MSLTGFLSTSTANSLVIPEVGLAHVGNLTLAYGYIDCLHKLGFKCVKFQAHSSIFESSPDEQFRVVDARIPSKSRFEYWDNTSFSIKEWSLLSKYAHDLGLLFAITPNSRQLAIELFENVIIDFWKVGSSDIDNFHLLDFLVTTGLPLIVSTGLANENKVLDVMNLAHEKCEIAFLSCISSYPSKLSDFSLPRLFRLQELVGNDVLVGLSDHSSSLAPIISSFVNGFRIFEFHISISEYIFNFDLSSSLLPSDANLLIHILNDLSACSENTSDALQITNSKVATLFTKRIHFACDLPKDSIIDSRMLSMLRSHAYDALPQSAFFNVLGKRLRTSVTASTPLTAELLVDYDS